jgi:heme oxygenase
MSTITSPLADALKQGTRELHVEAERHPLQQNMLRGTIARDRFAAYLNELHHIHTVLEDALRSSSHPAIAVMFQDHHLRAQLLAHDIVALSESMSERPRCRATRSFCGFIHDAATADPAALIGVLYVLEGSTNGNAFIARAIEKAYGLAPGVATRSLDPHGAEQRPRWQEFRAALDTLDLPDAEAARVISAARWTFRTVYDVADELMPS